MDLTAHTSLSPIRRGFAPGFVNYKKGCTRLAAASDTVYQLLAHGRWFSPGTPASSTTKTGRNDIAEGGVKHNKSINHYLDSEPTRLWSFSLRLCAYLRISACKIQFYSLRFDPTGLEPTMYPCTF